MISPEALDLTFPFEGRWLVQNSPANRVPSHGTTAFASSYAIDFVPVGDNGRSASVRFSTLILSESPERFPGFGRPVLAPVEGVVVALCHLQQASAAVQPGQPVRVGETVGRCGNSGNSTEPHLHVQALDQTDPDHARPVPITFEGTLPRNGEVVHV